MEVDRVISAELRSELNADKEARRACRAYRELSSRRLNKLDHSRIEMRDSCRIADITMTIEITEKAAVTLTKTKQNDVHVREFERSCDSKTCTNSKYIPDEVGRYDTNGHGYIDNDRGESHD
jgi:hypothetical protein